MRSFAYVLDMFVLLYCKLVIPKETLRTFSKSRTKLVFGRKILCFHVKIASLQLSDAELRTDS